MNSNNHETVPTKIYKVIDQYIKPYFKEEDWEDLELRLQDRFDEIFQDAAELELKNELSFMGLVSRMKNEIFSNRMIMGLNFILTIILFILLFLWT